MRHFPKHAEKEQFAQAQRDYFDQRESRFAGAETRRDTAHMARLTFNDADGKSWRTIHKITRPIGSPCLFLLTIIVVWNGGSLLAWAGCVGTIILATNWLFPHLMRTDHDRYRSGLNFERANASQSPFIAWASIGLGTDFSEHPDNNPWEPDTPNYGASLSSALALSFMFAVVLGEILTGQVM